MLAAMTTWVMSPSRLLAVLVLTSASLAFSQPKPGAAKPLTDAECEAFGHQLEDHFSKGDRGFYADSFDVDTMLDRALAVPGVDTTDIESDIATFKKAFKTGFTRQLSSQIQGLKFLRLRHAGRDVRLICRVTPIGGGMNYQELAVKRGADGKMGFVDMFIYLTGEMMSETIKRAIIPAVVEKQKSLVERLFGEKSDVVKYFMQWTEVAKLSSEGRHREALAAYAKLPASLQKEKFILVSRLKSASALGDDKEYLAALELWQRAYPKDPSLDLISIDAFILRKRYSKALESVDRLDQAVGGDPYLDYQRGMLYELMGDPAKSDEALNRAIEREPTLVVVHFLLFGHRVQEKNYPAAVAALVRMQKDTGYSSGRIASAIERQREYASFIKSDEYRNWRGLPPVSQDAQRPQPRAPATTPAKPEPTGLRLQSIVYRESGSSATINDKFLTVGKKISGHTVVAIDKDSVTIETPSGEKKVLRLGDVLE